MNTTETLSSLNLMTLGIGVLIAVVALLWFLRKRSNRHPLAGQREENIAERLDMITRDRKNV